jgi:DNA-binding GntR family transcriptional regulator
MPSKTVTVARVGARVPAQRAARSVKKTTRDGGNVISVDNADGLSNMAARAITERVLTGRCVPGQRLIEGDLARELKVGRGTIREALRRLAAERVIALVPHRGAFVRSLTQREMLELQDVISALYGLAVSLAAEAISTPEHRAQLSAAYERLVAGGSQSDRVLHALDRSGFYDVIFAISGNRELARIAPIVLVQIIRIQVHPFLSAADLSELFSDYHNLYEAIAEGNAARAKRLIEQHVRRRRQQIENLPAEAFAGETDYS